MFHRRTRHSMTGGAIAAATVLALSLVGCSADTSSDDASTVRGDTLTVGTTQPNSLNPTTAQSAQARTVCLAYDSLIRENSDGTFAPQLATDWGYVDEENKVFELTIREGVTFSDGDPLDAEAVAASLNASAASGVTAQLVGTTAEATDEYTVQLTSETPQPDYEIILSGYYSGGCIVSPTGLADPDALETESHGVGPYVIDSVNTGVEIVFRANDDYYDQSRVLYDEIVMKIFDSDTAATQALLSGQISMWTSSASQTWNDLADTNDLQLYIGNPNYNEIWIFDQQGQVTPALADVRVRQALNYAVDREAIAPAIFGPDATSRVQPANFNWVGFDEALESTYEYDPDKASELLEEAGYADGFTLPIAYFAATEAVQNLVEAVSSNLADVGITVELVPITTIGDIVPTISSGTVSAQLVPVDQRSVYQYVTYYHGTAGQNAAALGEVDEELMGLIDDAALENTEEAWQGVLTWLTENAFTLPIAQTSRLYIATNDVDLTDAYSESAGTIDVALIKPAE